MTHGTCQATIRAGSLARSIVTLAVCVGVVAAAGCSSTAPLEPLGVNLVNLEVQEITLFEATLVAQVRITNPNPDPLEFTGGSLKLLLDGKKAGTALAPEGFTVAGFDSTLVDMTVHVNTASAITRIPKMLEKESISYGASGSFYSQGSFGRVRHVVERSGTLDLKQRSQPDREDAVTVPSS
jgi:LEA14-like dessication related protein